MDEWKTRQSITSSSKTTPWSPNRNKKEDFSHFDGFSSNRALYEHVPSLPRETMVEVVKISKKGKLLWIKEIPD